MSRHRTLPDTHDPDNRRRRRRCRYRRTPHTLPSLFLCVPPPPFLPVAAAATDAAAALVSVSSHAALQRSYPRQSSARLDGFPESKARYTRALMYSVHLHRRSLVRARGCDRIIIYYMPGLVLRGPSVLRWERSLA